MRSYRCDWEEFLICIILNLDKGMTIFFIALYTVHTSITVKFLAKCFFTDSVVEVSTMFLSCKHLIPCLPVSPGQKAQKKKCRKGSTQKNNCNLYSNFFQSQEYTANIKRQNSKDFLFSLLVGYVFL